MQLIIRDLIYRSPLNIIRSMDLLIIDEISMVRADLLDAIDSVLRRYRTGINLLEAYNC